MSKAHQQYICQKLQTLEQTENIRILHAIESGSRAWGFPSKDSDFDIRFIYVRPKLEYLSINNIKDDIQTPIIADDYLQAPFDLAGWDLRKALKLTLKSNAIIREWLTSPIKYIYNNHFINELNDFYFKSTDIEAINYHYFSMALGVWKNYKKNTQTLSVKKYLYIIRPVLCMKYIRDNKAFPPMDVYSLLAGLDLKKQTVNALCELIENKAGLKEESSIKSISIIDSLIEEYINMPVVRIKPNVDPIDMKYQGSEFFRKFIDCN